METFAFEAMLPGIVEELVFRGVGPALLLGAFSAEKREGVPQIGPVLLTAVWFTSGHLLLLDHGHIQVVWRRLLDVSPMAIWYAVIRFTQPQPSWTDPCP